MDRTIARREFLRRSIAAASAPTVIAATALGGGGRLAPSERITMGFIGVGKQGGGHLVGGAWTYLTVSWWGNFCYTTGYTRERSGAWLTWRWR